MSKEKFERLITIVLEDFGSAAALVNEDPSLINAKNGI